MTDRIYIKNSKELKNALAKVTHKIKEANLVIAQESGMLVKKNAQAHIRPRPSGSGHRSKKGNEWYDTRPPFEPRPPDPTSRSGLLKRSIKVKIVKYDESTITYVGPTVKYGKVLEFGEGRLKNKYPYLANGFADSREGLITIYEVNWRKAFQ